MIGLPRYAEFLESLGLDRPGDWSDLSARPEVVADLRATYSRVEDVDTVVGLYAQFDRTNIPGHVVVDPAYVVFSVETPLRNQRDRFFREARNDDVYTEWGMEYLRQTRFSGILERHGMKPFLMQP